VVYADWFTGYGLLLIIDHGSGYMSLYGHNSNFRKKVNDQVEAGEIVALVGKSGCEEAGLYFAIRYNGRLVNPEQWCVR
jgi:septal ring factor EnvC (AmiA/AmiB activator)